MSEVLEEELEEELEKVLEYETIVFDEGTLTLQKADTQFRVPATYEEYVSMPEGEPYFQCINGKVLQMPAPSLTHQKVVRKLILRLGTYIEERDLGELYPAPVDVYFTEKDYYQPDIVFVSAARSEILRGKNIVGAPDLVVEVLSPSNGYDDLTHKKSVYEAEGVVEYWIVYPVERRVEILRNTDNGFVIHSQAQMQSGIASSVQSSVLHGFSLELASIFDV
jgi:Uma2 family endonuclease